MNQPNSNLIEGDVLIRNVTAADAQAIYRMLCELENTVLPLPEFLKIFNANLTDSNIRYLVAELESDCIGMASCHVQLLLHHASSVGEIQEMFVYPAYRSMGVGKLLVRSIIDFVRSKGATQLEVTSNKIRTDTHRFYEKEGFQKTHFKLILNHE
jgi:PhnO protein